MPWQQLVADTALEVDPDTGLLVYRKLVLTVPRQSGKTTLLLAKMVHRALAFGGRQRIVYTAQTRLKARQKWEDEHLVALQQSPFASLMLPPRKQIGQEAIRWRNGSLHGLDAPSEDAVHGDVLDEGVIDEAFAQKDARVEQGMKPAMLTRPEPQLDVVSTAGKSKAESPYLWGEIEAGRIAVEAGITSGVCFFEWSAPSDDDPGDPATWRSCMPALGITISEEAIRSDYESWTAKGELNEFRRGYLNQWVDESPQEWNVVPRATWAALRDPGSQISGPLAFAVDANPDRTWAVIGVAGQRADGGLHVEITSDPDDGSLDHRRGISWLVPRLRQLVERHRPCAVVVAPSGPANSLIPELEAADVEVLKPSVGEISGACGAFYDAATDSRTLRHLGQTDLDVALAGALKRDLGDRWLWTRKGIAVDISPLVAVTLAAWGLATRGHLGEETPPDPDIF